MNSGNTIRYETNEQLGTSGVSSVFKGTDIKTKQDVVIKKLRSYFATEDQGLDPFLEEMGRVTQLEHSNIVPVKAVEILEGETAIIMHYVPFPSLKTFTGNPLPLGEVIHIIKKVAAALDFAQTKNILHRDLKPSNIFYDSGSGDVLVSDFGITRLVENSPPLVRTTVNSPSPMYSAPEQNEGLHDNPRSDIYSLAIIAYELVTGEVPYDSLTPHSMLAKQIKGTITPVSSLVKIVPKSVDEVISKALEFKPEKRYKSCTEFVKELVSAAGPKLARKPVVSAKKLVKAEQAHQIETSSEEPTEETDDRVICRHCSTGNSAAATRCTNCWGSLTSQPTITIDEERRLISRYWGTLKKRKRSHSIATLLMVTVFLGWWGFNLMEVRPPLPDPSSTISSNPGPEEWVTAQRDVFHTGQVHAPEFDPIGAVAWSFEIDGPIINSAAVAGDLVFIGANDLRIVALNSETGDLVWEYPLHVQPNSHPTIAQDILYWGLRDGTLLALKYRTGELVWTYKTGAAIYSAPTVVDGTLYVGSSDNKIYSIDALTGAERWSRTTGNWVVGSASVDKGVLVFGGQDRELYMYDANNGTLRHQVNLGSGVDNSTIIVNDLTYVATRSGMAVAFDHTQKDTSFQKAYWRWWMQFWVWNIAPRPDPIPGLKWIRNLGAVVVGDMATNGEKLFASTTKGKLIAMDLGTGLTEWETDGLGLIYTAPIVSDQTIIQTSANGTVRGFDISTGEMKWEISVKGMVISSPVLAGGKLFIPTIEGTLFAIH
jgi:outer membrane protein assembly factor BamB/serine/threonine protein kinase